MKTHFKNLFITVNFHFNQKQTNMAGNSKVVVIAVDGSKHADYALEFYLKNVRIPNDKLLLIHVPQMYFLRDASPAVAQELMTKMKIEADKLKDSYKKKLSDAGVQGDVELAFGNAGEQIVAVAAKAKANVLIVGSRGCGLLRRTFLGSVSDYVLHHASAPVLITRLPDKD